jgi:hypothetical protein
MGLFKSISKATGIKAFGEIESFLGDPTGAKAASRAQVAALREAGRFEEAARLEAQQFRDRLLTETAPFREQAQAEFARLAQAAPGESQLFQQGLQRGTTGLAGRFSALGLGDSSAFGLATGELGASLLAAEERQRQAALANLANIGTTGLGVSLGAQQLSSGLAGRQAQTIADIGAAQALGAGANRGFFADILGTAGGVALGTALFSGAGAAPVGAAGAGAPSAFAAPVGVTGTAFTPRGG